MVLVICCFGNYQIVFAQNKPRPVTYQTTNQAKQAVSSARQVVATEPVKPVPDFWAIHSTDSFLMLPDRLDRKNLQMFYHLSFDQYYRTIPSVTPDIPTVPEPQYQNKPDDLESRLSVLRESTNSSNRVLAPTIPSPYSSDDSQQPAAVKIRRLPSVHGMVAIGDL